MRDSGIRNKLRTAWKVIAARKVGTSHRRDGVDCEDAFDIAALPGNIHVLAVADGAGSAPRGAEGARLAVEAVILAMKQRLVDGQVPDCDTGFHALLEIVLQEVRRSIEEKACNSDRTTDQPGSRASSVDEYATTLLLAIISQERVAILQIGDGMVVIEEEGGVYSCPIQPYRDSPYLNDTHFITDADYSKFVRFKLLEADTVHGIALLTDGLQLLASDAITQQPYIPFFKPLFAFTSMSTATDVELEAFLDSERVCQRTDDDKTLVLAVRM